MNASAAPSSDGIAAPTPAFGLVTAAAAPTAPNSAIPTPASVQERRARTPTPYAYSASRIAVPLSSAVLSCVPNTAIAKSFTPGGTWSTTTPPTATSGAERAPAKTASSSATPSAAAAAATPASPARIDVLTAPSCLAKLEISWRVSVS